MSKRTKTKINLSDTDTFVTCRLCNKLFPQITHTHLKHAHNKTLSEYMCMFNLLKNDVVCKNVISIRKVTLKSMISKYGVVEGNRRWEQYIQKQAHSNSFEYKQQKHGWSKERYDRYNQERACTRENFLKRHGIQEGEKLWNEYREKQRYAGTALEYFIEKHGEREGRLRYEKMLESKKNTLDAFIKKYGKVIGEEKWKRMIEKQSIKRPHSKMANQLFTDVLGRLPIQMHDSIYFNAKNAEYFFAKKGYKTLFVDFCCITTRKIIEFAGDYWHGNPETYAADFYNAKAKTTAEILHRKTLDRCKELEVIHNCKVLLIWENEYKKDKEQAIQKCINFLND